MPETAAGQAAARLEQVFRQIAATRMAGVSLLNPALAVEAVGFRPWHGDWVGVLVTPWFMNLICLPGPDAAWETRASGTRLDRELPSGVYEFLAADEDELGPYLSSSLFSPMFEFPDMDQAREVARAVLDELFTPVAEAPAEAQSNPKANTEAETAGLTAKLAQPVSRRGFFGALLRSEGPT
jgi:[NiFe] hydrogenase assembly HybE family chaperone